MKRRASDFPETPEGYCRCLEWRMDHLLAILRQRTRLPLMAEEAAEWAIADAQEIALAGNPKKIGDTEDRFRWLIQVGCNKLASLMRRYRRHPIVTVSEQTLIALEPLALKRFRREPGCRRDEFDAIHEALEKLPDDVRGIAYYLRFVDGGHSYGETARYFGTTRGRIQATDRKICNLLRGELMPIWEKLQNSRYS